MAVITTSPMFHIAVDTSRPASPVTRTVATALTSETESERERITEKDTVTISTNERSENPQANTTKSTSISTGVTVELDGSVYCLRRCSPNKANGV